MFHVGANALEFFREKQELYLKYDRPKNLLRDSSVAIIFSLQKKSDKISISTKIAIDCPFKIL